MIEFFSQFPYAGWQDHAIAVIQLWFSFALWPAIKSDDKPAASSSLQTGGFLYVLALVMLTLGLWWSAFTGALCASHWMVLLWQVKRRRRGGTA